MTGVTGDYLDRHEDEASGIVPTPAPGGNASPAPDTPASQPTVQSEQPGVITDPASGAPLPSVAPSQTAPAPTSTSAPVRPAQMRIIPASVLEAQERQRARKKFEDALSGAIERGGEDADALLIQDAGELARSFGLGLEDILPGMERLKQQRQDREFKQQGWREDIWNELKRSYHGIVANRNALEALRALRDLRYLDTFAAEATPGQQRVFAVQREQLVEKLTDLIASSADRRSRSQALPVRPETREFLKFDDWDKIVNAFGSDPAGVAGDVVLRGLPGLAVGAMELGKGRLRNSILAGAMTSFYQELFTGFLDNFKDENGNPINTADPKVLKAALQNPAILNKALGSTLINGAVGAVGGGGGKILGAKDLSIGDSPIIRMITNGVHQELVGAGISISETTLKSLATTGEWPSKGEVVRDLMTDKIGDAAGAGLKSVGGVVAGPRPPTYQVNRNQRIDGLIKHAQGAQESAGKFAAALRRVQDSARMTSDPDAMKSHLDSLGPGEKIQIPAEVARNWIRDKKVDDDFLVRSGIAAELNGKKPGDDITLDKSALLTAGLRPEIIDDVAQNIRSKPGGMTAREAAAYLGAREAHLKKFADAMQSGKWEETDGSLAYLMALQDARNKGLDHNAARIEAARETERIFNRVIEQAEQTGTSESVDALFLREYYRRTYPNRDHLPPDAVRRLEDGYVHTKLMRLKKPIDRKYRPSDRGESGDASAPQP